MRPAVLNAYATMLPRLEAEKQLATERLVRAATGGMKQSHRLPLLAGLAKVARGGRRKRARKATAADLAAMGIPVEEVPVKGGET